MKIALKMYYLHFMNCSVLLKEKKILDLKDDTEYNILMSNGWPILL